MVLSVQLALGLLHFIPAKIGNCHSIPANCVAAASRFPPKRGEDDSEDFSLLFHSQGSHLSRNQLMNFFLLRQERIKSAPFVLSCSQDVNFVRLKAVLSLLFSQAKLKFSAIDTP